VGLDLTVAGRGLEDQLMRTAHNAERTEKTPGADCARRPRTARALTTALLGLGVLLGPAALPALADAAPSDDPSSSSSPSGDAAAPTEAGTSFRTAAAMRQDQEATASASSGDYLYWSFPADAGQRPTVEATVKLPSAPALHGGSTWGIDVYDGLRRRQPCMYGMQTRTVLPDAGSVRLSCTLRPVRASAEPWADDPLPGTYYIRLTAVDLGAADVGLPFQASVKAVSHGLSGAYAVGGSLGKPLVPGISMATQSASGDAGTGSDSGSGDISVTLSKGEPEDGWSSGWWSDRWIWTGVGGVLAALAGVGGYALTRGRGPRYRVPPQA
jgi:hypothetical protein